MIREEQKSGLAQAQQHTLLMTDHEGGPEYDGDGPTFEQPTCRDCGSIVLWSEIRAGVECAECGAELEG